MDNNIKISLTISLPGSTMYSEKEVTSSKKEDKTKINNHSIKVSGNKEQKPSTIYFTTRKCKPATQTINLTKEAFDYMISDSCPEWITNKGNWKRKNKLQKVEEHLNRMAEYFGGEILSYKIFEE